MSTTAATLICERTPNHDVRAVYRRPIEFQTSAVPRIASSRGMMVILWCEFVDVGMCWAQRHVIRFPTCESVRSAIKLLCPRTWGQRRLDSMKQSMTSSACNVHLFVNDNLCRSVHSAHVDGTFFVNCLSNSFLQMCPSYRHRRTSEFWLTTNHLRYIISPTALVLPVTI